MPSEGHSTITVSDDLHKKIGILKKERERELGLQEMSLDQFMQMMVSHWEKTSRVTSGDHRTPQRSKSSNVRGRRDA